MGGVCDICNQPSWGFEFEVTAETGEKERRHICFECAVKRAQIIEEEKQEREQWPKENPSLIKRFLETR